jgi:pyruvate kinase
MPTTRIDPHAVLSELKGIRQSCVSAEGEYADYIAEACVQSKWSVRNLIHYLALRRYDLRQLQPKLASMGLSSLGRAEASTLDGLDTVIGVLDALVAQPVTTVSRNGDLETGQMELKENANSLLGPPPKGRGVRIMVTLSTEAAYAYELVQELIAAGTEIIRINCAHDSPKEWSAMVENVRRAARELGRSCKVLMDLAGSKLRTGLIMHGFHVARWRVQKDVRGHVITSARILLVAKDAPASTDADVVLPVAGTLVGAAEPGDVARFRDTRNRKRELTITEKANDGCIAECSQGAYVLNGTMVTLQRHGKVIAKGRIHGLPFVEEPIRLHSSDFLVVTKAVDSQTRGKLPHVSCTLPEVFATAQAGEPIFFDDGKIEGVIREVDANHMRVEILHAETGGANLGSAKGINLPKTNLAIPAITEKDLQDMEFVVEHADLVGLSFVRCAEDVLQLQEELAKRGKKQLGIVIKVESRQAFDHLPLILMAALRHHPVGIMVARGDLAVEMGFDRLAEVQEEILWLSEAAHVPVIWATQVLETLAKTGMPSRAEVTDAAMSVRAECVMLNKGEHIVEAVRFLDNILHRMQAHQVKKRSMLRRLAVADSAIA